VNTLREWKLGCPKGERDLAFPNIHGGLDHQSSVIQRSFQPAQLRAGLVNKQGRAKYGGLHSLRHFYASWCINRKADGGMELPPKDVQYRLGHASIQRRLSAGAPLPSRATAPNWRPLKGTFLV
jgi:integrase